MHTSVAALVCLSLCATLTAQDPEPEPKGPAVGKAAPSFRLNDQTGKAVALGGASDTWTVLAFYPKAATPG